MGHPLAGRYRRARAGCSPPAAASWLQPDRTCTRRLPPSGAAMFDRLSDAFSAAYRKLSGKGTISESNVREAIDAVGAALLEADVNAQVVKGFVEQVLADSVGHQVTKSLKPGEEMIGLVHHRLIELLGGQITGETDELGRPVVQVPEPGIMHVAPPPTIVMMCGLQGSGKTTTCGKLAAYLKKRGRSVMLVAADLQRPAAVEQLHIVAEQVKTDLPGGAAVSFYSEPDKTAAYGKAVGVAVGVCQRAVQAAMKQGLG